MQGELQEIDLRSLLELAALGQRTGQLLIEPPPQSPVSNLQNNGPGVWQISFVNGKIIYAGHAKFGHDRLNQLIRRYGQETLPKDIEISPHQVNHPWEYAALLALLESQSISLEQVHSILRQMIQESLLEMIALNRGRFFFVTEPLGGQTAIAPFEVLPLLQWVTQQRQEWQGFYPYIQSPDHYPRIVEPEALGQALSVATVNTLLKFADGQASLRHLSHRFDRNLTMIARAIYPRPRLLNQMPPLGGLFA
jgi:twitching motility two-component system response regulator PilG